MTQFDTPQSVCILGHARCEITPPVGMYHRMWGAATHDRSTGIHRPLLADVVVFRPVESNDHQQQILITLDHCLFRNREMDQFTQRVCAAANIPAEQLLVTFSHTHGAGLMEEDREQLPGGDLIAPYLQESAAKIATAITQAIGSLQTVSISYAQGHCSLAAHRDYWDTERKIFVCGLNPHETADDTVLTAQVTTKDNRLLLTLVNYACHPTTLAWDNEQISPDYPGAMRELVEETTKVPCVFLLGACGDLGPHDVFVGDVDVADHNGRQLGHAALSLLESFPKALTKHCYTGPVISGATIGVWAHQPLTDEEIETKKKWLHRDWNLPLPYRDDLPTLCEAQEQQAHWKKQQQLAEHSGDRQAAKEARAMVEQKTRQLTRVSQQPPGDCFPYRILLWKIGDAVWLAVEGEPYNLLQRSLRERFPKVPIIVMVLSGGSRPSYLPTVETYGKKIYQEQVAILAPGSLEQVLQEIGRQIEKWSAL